MWISCPRRTSLRAIGREFLWEWAVEEPVAAVVGRPSCLRSLEGVEDLDYRARGGRKACGDDSEKLGKLGGMSMSREGNQWNAARIFEAIDEYRRGRAMRCEIEECSRLEQVMQDSSQLSVVALRGVLWVREKSCTRSERHQASIGPPPASPHGSTTDINPCQLGSSQAP